MANPSLLISLSLAVLALFSACLAHHVSVQAPDECRLDQLNAIEPTNRVQSEAGLIEYWDPRDPQLQCAGVAMLRVTIRQNGLYLPTYSNGPIMAFVVQGQGVTGSVTSGCPETYQESQEFGQEQQDLRLKDMHQKVRQMRKGDVLVFTAGTAHWYHNDGNSPLVFVALVDVSNYGNQLDRILRTFHLAGSNPQLPERSLFAGFETEILAQSFNIRMETAEKLKNLDDSRGNIVNIPQKLQFVRPPTRGTTTEQREQYPGPWGEYDEEEYNGLEETVCTQRLQENLDDPSRADIYDPEAGRISTLNSLNLPILRRLRLGAARVFLHRNAMVLPHWNMNAHSLMYVTGGRLWVEVVKSNGEAAFKGEVRQGQLLLVPQGFAVIKRSESEGCEYIAFRTNDNAVVNMLTGRLSAMAGLPVGLVANGFRVSLEEAREIKYNRQETMLAAANPSAQGTAEA